MFQHPLHQHLLAFLLAFVLPLVAIFAWWGGFRSVSLETVQAGPYHYVYLEQRGDYARLPELAERARRELQAQGIPPGTPITVLYSNPDVVQMSERVGRAGFLVAQPVTPRPPLQFDVIPARTVLRARVQAGSLLAPSKLYAALDAHQQARGQGIVMPTVELYTPSDSLWRMGVMTVEMELRPGAAQ